MTWLLWLIAVKAISQLLYISFPGLDGTSLPPPPAQRSTVLDKLFRTVYAIYIQWSLWRSARPTSGETSVDLWEIDRLPRMHNVADRSSEKDNVRLSHANIVSYGTLFLWDGRSASRR